ncbi:Malate-2H(+)/Na(+)-lactate antiporter [Jeotgalicoccus saudimassiliensis]|uniref:Malate-2H(+)/Na(+)-lactate antiporter n=1 Tax=Jeotgalicoccus saudimassiliensis TaxID=1461582 RepID=A0A078M0Q2_9STAP|nr:Na+/H+ antiporter NhaC family protein [Jeotgalicoccus saudimassiliensis]CEA00948.1 Malate-2H(+)/Na(+)-lactate antiporter [Jeotgalicoccus saudimassiliensis]
MEYGFLSLLPPLLAIIIAILTKQTVAALFLGVWFGATVMNGWNPASGFTYTVNEIMVPSIADPWNASLILLVVFTGGFINVLRTTGAGRAFGEFATRKVNTRQKGQNFVWGSAFLFSYTEPVLILGTVTRPITDKLKISRVKLAYIVDSMGSPVASMSPISVYAPFITGLIATQLAALSLSENPWSLFIQMIPFHLYGIFAILGVLLVVNMKIDIGPMYKAEQRAIKTGKLYGEHDKLMINENGEETNVDADIFSFLIPLGLLFTGIFGVIFWTGDIASNGLAGAFLNADIIFAITTGFFLGSLGGMLYAKLRYNQPLIDLLNGYVDGIMQVMIVPVILVMAWSIGTVATEMGLGEVIAHYAGSYLPAFLVPVIIFLLGGLIAFASGSSWGVFSIMIPIAIPMGAALDLELALVIGAAISGGVFGDHCSPISDTSIMSSTGSAADHMEHIRTQLPYAIMIALAASTGFLMTGVTQNSILGIVTTAVVLVAILQFVKKRMQKKHAAFDG